MLALDKQTGQKVWQTKECTDGAQYASVVRIRHDGLRLPENVPFWISSVPGTVVSLTETSSTSTSPSSSRPRRSSWNAVAPVGVIVGE